MTLGNERAEEYRVMKIQAALEAFQASFADEKTRKSREHWMNYFLSETFLEVQFMGEFAEQVFDYLRRQDETPYKELPPTFLFELVTAYGMESLIDKRKGLVQADFMDMSFDQEEISPWRQGLVRAMRVVGEIWNAQDISWRRDRGARTIRKWEYCLRGRAFADYIRLCVKHDAGVRDWEEDPEREGPFMRGKWSHIQTGKYSQNSYDLDVRNECILVLYAYFLRTHQLPEHIYVWLWREYELSEIKAGQRVRAYEGIRQAILEQCPSVEAIADQEKAEEEQYHNWKQQLNSLERKYQYDGWAVKPRVPYEFTYALSAPVVSEQEQSQLQELFDSPVFQKYKYDDDLLWDLDYHCVAGNCTLGMAEVLFRIYMDSRNKGPKIDMFLEHVKKKLNYFERLSEYLCWEPFAYDCSTKAADFWYYYLCTAFEGRCTTVQIVKDFSSFIEEGMIRNHRKYLSGYLEQLYHPSMEWRRRFVGSSMTGRIDEPRCMEIRFCKEQKFDSEVVVGIEFHLHFIRFYWNGAVWEGQETLSFQELLQCAGAEGDEERFMLLLALTGIDISEREMAQEAIRSRLGKLPVDAFCLDFVAECLANGYTEEYSSDDEDDLEDEDDFDEDDLEDEDDFDEGEDVYDEDDDFEDDDFDDDLEDDFDEDDDEYDEVYQDFDYKAHNNDIKNNLNGQKIQFAENLTGRYRVRRDAAGDVVYSKRCFCGWQTICASKWSLWEESRELVRYGLISLDAPVNKRVEVKGMSELEKAQQICVLLEENYQQSLTQHRKNLQWLEKCGILAGNSVILCYGDQDSCYLEKALNTGLYTEKRSMEDAYAITKKEKNYRVGWLFQDWDSYKTIIAVGESGALWYDESPSSFRTLSADSLAEVIAKRYRLAEVTAICLKGRPC